MAIDRKKFIMGFLLAFFMITSVFGVVFFGFSSGESSVKYGTYTFKRFRDQWAVKINDKKLLFAYHPLDVEYINISDDAKQKLLNAKMLYLTSDFNSTTKEAIAQFNFQIIPILTEKRIFAVPGFLQKTPYDFPVFDCRNATDLVPVMVLQYGDTTSINNEGNCLTAQGDSYDAFDRLRDRIIYLLYGVMK